MLLESDKEAISQVGFQVVYYSANLANLELHFPSSPLLLTLSQSWSEQKCK